MRNIFKKNIRFENCFYILFCLVGIFYSINNIKNNNIIGIIVLALCVMLLVIKIYYLTTKKHYVINRVLLLVAFALFVIIVLDKIIFEIIKTFIDANKLQIRPSSLDPLGIRLAYLIINNYKVILSGVWTTIWLSLCGTLVGLIIALLFINVKTMEIKQNEKEIVAFMKKISQYFIDIYVTIFRGTPMIVQAIIIYYFLPGVLSSIFNINQELLNNILSVSVAGFITVTLNTAAYLTEVLRGGIESINKGQIEAARSLGMTQHKAMKYIIIPQGLKNSLPSICNEFIINIKDTSVLSVISVMDLFFIINSLNKKNANQDGIFIAAIIYLILTLSISKIISKIEQKMNIVSKPIPSCN